MQITYFFILWASTVLCDVYMHNPPGSNNRLYENRAGDMNDRRLFNSQNAFQAGYQRRLPGNVTTSHYYAGSTLRLKWTTYPACSPQYFSDCSLVLQYMCSYRLRDGRTPATIGDEPDRDDRCGMHENERFRRHCFVRQRNKRVKTPQQFVCRSSACSPDNENGVKYGNECPEERFYHPSWIPSPWVDIAVLTTNTERCHEYRTQSHNIRSRSTCSLTNISSAVFQYLKLFGTVPSTRQECNQARISIDGSRTLHTTWISVPKLGKASPVCLPLERERTQHSFEWTLPTIVSGNQTSGKCVVRIRYNLTTFDSTDSHTSTRTRLTGREASKRYVFERHSARVQLFPDISFSLAVDSSGISAFHRVYEDRSHAFEIRQVPTELSGREIYNIDMIGDDSKSAGNVYPRQPKSLVPNKVDISNGSIIRFHSMNMCGGRMRRDFNDGCKCSNLMKVVGNRLTNTMVQESDGSRSTDMWMKLASRCLTANACLATDNEFALDEFVLMNITTAHSLVSVPDLAFPRRAGVEVDIRVYNGKKQLVYLDDPSRQSWFIVDMDNKKLNISAVKNIDYESRSCSFTVTQLVDDPVETMDNIYFTALRYQNKSTDRRLYLEPMSLSRADVLLNISDLFANDRYLILECSQRHTGCSALGSALSVVHMPATLIIKSRLNRKLWFKWWLVGIVQLMLATLMFYRLIARDQYKVFLRRSADVEDYVDEYEEYAPDS